MLRRLFGPSLGQRLGLVCSQQRWRWQDQLQVGSLPYVLCSLEAQPRRFERNTSLVEQMGQPLPQHVE